VRILLLILALGIGASTNPLGKDPIEFGLKAAQLEDGLRVPMALEVRLNNGVPVQALLTTQRALVDLLQDAGLTEEKGVLLVPRGDSRPLKLKPGRPKVVEFVEFDRAIPVLFYTKGEQWCAAPAAILRGKCKAGVLELLDANLDGHFDESLDFLAWNSGAWRLIEKEALLPGENGLYALEVVEGKRGLLAQLSLEKLPPELGGAEVGCWRNVNALRNAVGLAPVRLSLARCAAAHDHASYLQRNGPSGSGSINVHDEDPELPGYTKEGHRAAGGNVGWGSGGRNLAAQPGYEFATLFHRGEFLYPSPDMGGGAVGGYSVVWVEQQQTDLGAWLSRHRVGSHWVMVPAPGQLEVPTRALRDSPTPASAPDFYTRGRGWPVSVSTSYSYRAFESASLKVYDSNDREVDGFLFTLSDAGFTSQGFPADWIWAAKTPFEGDAEYRAEFRAVLKPDSGSTRTAQTLSFDWTFRTATHRARRKICPSTGPSRPAADQGETGTRASKMRSGSPSRAVRAMVPSVRSAVPRHDSTPLTRTTISRSRSSTRSSSNTHSPDRSAREATSTALASRSSVATTILSSSGFSHHSQ
jgi:hypothetical protein